MKVKQFFGNCMLLLGTLLFIFFVFELFVRIFYPHSGYSITQASWGWTHVPNSKVTYYKEIPEFNLNVHNRPHPIPIEYNSKGLREFEYDYKKEDNVFRILILGDSFAEDMGSFFENLHTKWLERKLNKGQYPYKVEVINGGHYAFDNANEYMFYLKEGRKYSPDIVVVMFTGDTAGPDYAILNNGKLILNYKDFTPAQKRYRAIISWIRRHSHFGSFAINQITKMRRLKTYLINKGFKEQDKPVVNSRNISRNVEFSETDRAIWISLRDKVEEDGATLVFLNCAHFPDKLEKSSLNEKGREFIVENKILLLEINATDKEASRLKKEDLRLGTYDKFYDSHRFGYKMNEKVAESIIEFLLKNNLLPEKL